MVMNPRALYVTPGKQPFEVALLAACLLVGASLALTGLRPPSLARGLAEGLMTTWLALIAIGGAVGLVGVYWRRAITDGLLIEFGGVVAIASACTLYVAALFAVNPLASVLGSGGLIAGVAVGAAWRAVQCVQDFRKVRRSHVREVTIEIPLLVEDDDAPGPHDQTGGS